MVCNAVDVTGVNFIGIGKIMLDTQKTVPYNIPHLHCIFSQEKNEFEAINLEFGLVSTASSPAEAIANLAEMLITYFQTTISIGEGFKPFIQIVSRCVMDRYWAEYRKIEFAAAEKKADLGHTLIEKITNSVRNDLFKKYGIKPKAEYTIFNNRDAA